MIQSIRTSRRQPAAPAVQMAPLIDMMFTLLLFFVVTTSFVRETGIDVSRPTAVTAAPQDRSSVLVGISPAGAVYFQGHTVELITLRSLLRQELHERQDRTVVVVVDRAASSGRLVEVIDECKLAGADRIAVAAERE
jgi:biopolymer transport protein ExbD